MTKIFIDTTKFINFYQATHDPLSLLSELAPHAASLVFTQQSIEEFHRNRASTLKWLASAFNKSVESLSPYATSILRASAEYQELIKLRDALKKQAKAVTDYIKKILEDESHDPVAKGFTALLKTPSTTIATTDELIAKAHRRKLVGNPPTSSDKYTIGDELNWECLLSAVREDLIIVSDDSTYSTQFSVLQKEFLVRSGHDLVLVTNTLREAISAAGSKPSATLVKEEETIESEPRRTYQDIFVENVLFGKGGVLAGPFVQGSGAYVPPPVTWRQMSDYFGQSPSECPRCKTVGTWDGKKCFTCGYAAE